jgi:hypothetical protein
MNNENEETEYYIYHNWTAERGHKAIIHKSNCPFCRNGKGIHPIKSDFHGEWLGPYKSKQLAYEAAVALGAYRVDFCKKE